MSKLKRNKKGQFRDRHSKTFLAGCWFGSLLSVGLVLFIGNALVSSFASFRSCNANSAGLKLVGCGKQGINIGDLLLMLLFLAAVGLAMSLITASWKLSTKQKLIEK